MSFGVASTAAEALRTQQASLAQSLVERQFALSPQLAERYGAAGRIKCLEDANFHLSFLAEAVDLGHPEMFADYIAWVKVMLTARGIPPADLVNYLTLLCDVLLEALPAEAGTAAARVVDQSLRELPNMPLEVASFLDPQAPLTPLAHEYLALLQRGERQLACQRILDAAAAGSSVRDIYLGVFQPTQREVGRLWQMNHISVAQEHYFTATTQWVMSRLYPQVFTEGKDIATLVATCVSGNLHELGIRMLADLFEIRGWKTFFLGSNTPTAAVLEMVAQQGAQVLAISATLMPQVTTAQSLIAKLRTDRRFDHVRVLVGGHPFNLSPGLWRKIGADGHARDADEAIELAERLIGVDS
ncbi:MAG: cobalamin B12-binding domain protein [Betaproteobacteria bacterium HGW-Betaproteobacteria-16]|nr:MAG: cobalamin B12-binding domain protein [Betaproteobacteria bacterium HGW-Betaproteobacteria-16]